MSHLTSQDNMVPTIVLFPYAVGRSFSINNGYYSLRIGELSSKAIDFPSVPPVSKLLRRLFAPFWILKVVISILVLKRQLIRNIGMYWGIISPKTTNKRCLKHLEELHRIFTRTLSTNWILNLCQSERLLSKICRLLHRCKFTLSTSLKSRWGFSFVLTDRLDIWFE
jgi:hypothetical protein